MEALLLLVMVHSAVSRFDALNLSTRANPGTVDGPSKAAVIHLTKMQASKLAPLNVMVNCVCP